MGRRGPPPKPTKVNDLAGNPGKRKRNPREPAPAHGRPDCPGWLSDKAQAEWRLVVPQLEAAGLLAKIDRAALICYCQAVADVEFACAAIEEHGRTYVLPNATVAMRPEVKLLAEASKRLRLFAAEFGLSPSARSRIQLPEKPPAANELDELLSDG